MPARLAVAPLAWAAARAEAAGEGWLSAQERDRLATLHAPQRRRQFLAGRWWARCQLADAVGGDWASWRLSAPDDGPAQVLAIPENCSLAQAPHLSISHSEAGLAVALADRPVGVDLQSKAKPRDFGALIDLITAPEELADLAWGATEDVAVRAAHFYSLWALKEAWFKWACACATGDGARPAGLRSFRFRPCAQGQSDALVLHDVEFALAAGPLCGPVHLVDLTGRRWESQSWCSQR